jgi:aminoglycoside phosphotransferase (APT) family kinase protein
MAELSQNLTLIGNVSRVTPDFRSAAAGLAFDSCDWVARTLGGVVVHVERFTRGREVWWVDVRADGIEKRWLLKGRRAPAAVIAGSALLTDFGVARESAAMRALAGSDVLVPAVGGFDAASALLLIEQVIGTALVQHADPHERHAVIRHYARQLAAMHRLDWRALDVDPAISVPTDAQDMALGGWLRSAEIDFATAAAKRRHPEPLLDLAVRWLHQNVPPGRDVEHLRLLHGDAGVNNFLFADSRVTALIDWELAIIGDPMSDLGNARYREALYPSGTYATLISAYEAATDEPVDRAAIGYYTALAAMSLSLAMVANMHHPRAGQPEVVARMWQDALARCVAAEAIAEVIGLELEYDALEPPAWSAFDAQLQLLADRLDREVSLAEPGQPAAEAFAYAQLGQAARTVVRASAWVGERFLDDVASMLGLRSGSVPDALGTLADLVACDPGGRLRALLSVLARDARRRLEILRPLQAAEVWEGTESAVRSDAGAPTAHVLPDLPLPKPNSDG